MKRISIDLSEPIESILAQALALPAGIEDGQNGDALVNEAVHRLFDAAHGRSVETALGRIAIAPAVAPWLKAAPLAVRTRQELLTLAGIQTHGNGSANPSELATP